MVLPDVTTICIRISDIFMNGQGVSILDASATSDCLDVLTAIQYCSYNLVAQFT